MIKRNGSQDVRSLHRLVRELNECQSWGELARHMVERLDTVVPGENPVYNEIELPSHRVVEILMHEHYMDEAARTLPAYNHYAMQHPLLKLGCFTDSIGRVHSFSDCILQAEIERNPVYNEVLKFTDAKDQMLFNIVIGGNRFITICQNRLKWGYHSNEADRMQRFADLVIPVMKRKHHEITENERMQLLLAKLEEVLGCQKADLLSVTPAEIQVASEVIGGYSHREIATRRGISTRTVAAHSGALFEKLHFENRFQFTAAFREAFDALRAQNT